MLIKRTQTKRRFVLRFMPGFCSDGKRQQSAFSYFRLGKGENFCLKIKSFVLSKIFMDSSFLSYPVGNIACIELSVLGINESVTPLRN